MRTVDMKLWNFKAIDVINGHVRRHDEKREAMQQGLDLMRAGHISTGPLVARYDLSDVEQAFQDFMEAKEGLFKAVLTMEGERLQ